MCDNFAAVIRFFTIPIVLLFFCTFSLKTIVLIQFEINRSYIEKELCEKKDEVNNCCKGNCYLNKQLEKTNTQSLPLQPKYPDQKELVFHVEFASASIPIPSMLSLKARALNEETFYCAHLESLKHPPAL